MKILNVICARANSKGIKNKNIKLFCGKPLIYWTLQHCKNSKTIGDVYLSTDSKKIKKIGVKYGAKADFLRPKNLSKDDTPEINVWKHITKFYEKKFQFKYDAICSISVTSPLRAPTDIDKCVQKFKKNKNLDLVVVVTKAKKNPYFNILEKNNNNELKVSKKTKKKIFRRQDVPEVYDLTTIAFVIKRDFLMKSEDIKSGKIGYIIVPETRSIDIDNIDDFRYAEYLFKLKNKKLKIR